MNINQIKNKLLKKKINVREAYNLISKYFNPKDDLDRDIENVLLIASWLKKMNIKLYGRDEYEQTDIFEIIWGHKNDPLDDNDKEPKHITYRQFLELDEQIVAIMPLGIYGYKYMVMDQYRSKKKAVKKFDEAKEKALEFMNGDKSKILTYPGKPFLDFRKNPVDDNFKLYPVYAIGEEYFSMEKQENIL